MPVSQDLGQEGRLGKLHCGLGKDVLALRRFSGTEAVNELFTFEVEALSVRENIDFDELLGKNVTIEIETVDKAHPARCFDGLLVSASWIGHRDGAHGYRLTLRPWLWLLTLRRNQRIFHDKTAPEILAAVFQDYGFSHDAMLSGSYGKLEYTVQYGESDFDFVSRMMERFGINYHFVHEKGAHKLVLCDSNDAYPPVVGGSRDYLEVLGQHRRDAEHFHDWASNRVLTAGLVSVTDYDFKKPTTALAAQQAGGADHAFGDIESFEFPGGYHEPGDGKQVSQLRMAQKRAADRRHTARGDVLTLGAGMTVKLRKHPDAQLNDKEFLAIRCTHSYEGETYASGAGGSPGGDPYQGAYEFVRIDHSFVPEVRTPASRIRGPQTAVVVGEGEIDCDEHGRILVRFHWDREQAHSMRCRVAQMWAGNGWGGIVIPRVGMEVVVMFIDGDPDNPLVVGCVYNGENKPPFDLPGSKNQTGIKSSSTPGGGGYNELVFDDTDGKELFRQHAQYDMETTILNDERRAVGRDQQVTVGRDRSATIGQHDRLSVGKNLTTEVGGNENRSVGKKSTVQVGQTLDIKAGQKITLTVGASSIEMDSKGVTIKALQIAIKATGELKLSGTMTDLGGSATVMIKGGMVMIN